MPHEYHTPVLLEYILQYLPPMEDGIFVDATVGGGGHAEKILARLPQRSRLACFDMDDDALAYARQRLLAYGDRVFFFKDNFKNLRTRLKEINITAVNGVLLDLGVSSYQIDQGSRGFSFQEPGRIDMRMNSDQRLDGWTVVNSYSSERLMEIIARYGEERFTSRITRNIIKARQGNAMNTNADLAHAVESAVGGKMLPKSLARVFQAIRIEVNGELENLQKVLDDSPELLVHGGRVMVISYHSLEDRIVKQWIKKESQAVIRSGHKLVPDQAVTPRLLEVTKKPLVPDEQEIRMNPRSRSAKLRIAEKI
jgi:16S rRNA (cytosine1402-N4)-methyltransferase